LFLIFKNVQCNLHFQHTVDTVLQRNCICFPITEIEIQHRLVVVEWKRFLHIVHAATSDSFISACNEILIPVLVVTFLFIRNVVLTFLSP
jgi:hypothetical protein